MPRTLEDLFLAQADRLLQDRAEAIAADYHPASASRSFHAIDAIAAATAPQLEKILQDAIDTARGEVDPEELGVALASGEYERAWALLLPRVEALQAAIEDSRSALEVAYLKAGEAAARSLSEQIGRAVSFDSATDASIAWLDFRISDLSTWIADSSRQAFDAVAEQMRKGVEPAAAAELIGATFGLGPKDVGAIVNASAKMVSDGSDAEATASESERYAAELTASRADLFGSGQAYQAAQAGQQEAWLQAKDAGLLGTAPVRYWGTQRAESVCAICRPMDGQMRGLNEPFVSPTNGQRYMNPGDPHERCECWAVILAVGS